MNLPWTEKYRPSTLDGYVFTNSNQKNQIERWVQEGTIPHCLFVGSPGCGKCLDAEEPIRVKSSIIDWSKVKKTPNADGIVTLSIGELFKAVDLFTAEYEQVFDVDDLKLLIENKGGYVPVRGLVRKRATVARYFLDSGESITCSTKHLIFELGKPTPISTAKYIDTAYGIDLIRGEVILGERDVFDVALDAPHRYMTPNGVYHHNTTLAKILINELNIDRHDVMEINASRENSVEQMRDKITGFISTLPFGKFKVVLLDEADYLSVNAMSILRGLMETYVESSRFILTANYGNKIIPAIHSRCQKIQFENLDTNEFTAKLAEILITEGIEFDLDLLDNYVKASYPDLRKCINNCSLNSVNGKLLAPEEQSSDTKDYRLEAVTLIKQGKIREARQLICTQVTLEEVTDLYRWFYNNLDFWGDTNEQKDQAICVIRKALVNDSLVADREINLAACMVELDQIKKS